MKGPAFFHRQKMTKKRKYIDEKKNLLYRTAGPISTKFDTKPSWMKGIQFCLFFFQKKILRNSENTSTKFRNLLQNYWANFNQTWNNASLGSKFVQMKGYPLFQGDIITKQQNWYTWTKLKYFLLQNRCANFNQICNKACFGEGDSSLIKWRTIQF